MAMKTLQSILGIVALSGMMGCSNSNAASENTSRKAVTKYAVTLFSNEGKPIQTQEFDECMNNQGGLYCRDFERGFAFYKNNTYIGGTYIARQINKEEK